MRPSTHQPPLTARVPTLPECRCPACNRKFFDSGMVPNSHVVIVCSRCGVHWRVFAVSGLVIRYERIS